MIPPVRADRRRARACSSPTCASRPSGWPTCARRRRAWLVGADRLRELADRFGRRRCWPRAWTSSTRYSERRIRAGDRPAARRRATAAARRDRGRRHPHARHPDPRSRCGSRATSARPTSPAPRRSSRATSTARSPSPARPSTTCVRAVCDPDIPASGGAFAPVDGGRAGGLPGERAAAGAPSSPATPRRRAGSSTSSCRRSAGPCDVPAHGQGTMNNVTFGTPGFTYYETLGGGQGGVAGRARAERRPRRDVEHAEHADRGARARVPAADRALRAAAAARAAPAVHRGGDGVVRVYRVLADCRLGLMTERRRHAPARRRGRRATARRAATA